MEPVLIDSLWVLFCAFLVFFMHAGFALLECGFCRKKNAVTVLLKNLGVVAIASLLFYTVGFGIMFGEPALGNLIGSSGFAPGLDATLAGTPENLPLHVFLFFQLMFAATAVTIVSGAVAERVRLAAFALFGVVAIGLIYPVIGHWVWGGGFLAKLGFHDFAGSTVVHAVGGAMALTGAIFVGPRMGKYGRDGKPRALPAHNFPLAALGLLVLWLGWFGFNGGSTLAFDAKAVAGILIVTNLAASAGFLAAIAAVKHRTGMFDLSMGINGALAGLVAITAGCDVISPLGAIGLGAIAGVVVVTAALALERKGVDDPVGAVAVHGVCGVLGTLAVGVLATDSGLLYGGGLAALGKQALGVGVAVGFALVASAATWSLLRIALGSLRADPEHEHEGLDVAECGAPAYAEWGDVPSSALSGKAA